MTLPQTHAPGTGCPFGPRRRPGGVALARYTTELPDLRGLCVRAGRLAYRDERAEDRDEHGVLWARVAERDPADLRQDLGGSPHPVRQRELMRHLRCQVCAAPAQRDRVEGVTWVLPYAASAGLLRQRYRPYGTARELLVEGNPPVCERHAAEAPRRCPELRVHGWTRVVVASAPLHGVAGLVHDLADLSRPPVWAPDLPYGDPRLCAVLATDLTRVLDLPISVSAVPPVRLRKATP
ncbi:hypothetical protein [Streptomyces sp. NPDC001054]